MTLPSHAALPQALPQALPPAYQRIKAPVAHDLQRLKTLSSELDECRLAAAADKKNVERAARFQAKHDETAELLNAIARKAFEAYKTESGKYDFSMRSKFESDFGHAKPFLDKRLKNSDLCAANCAAQNVVFASEGFATGSLSTILEKIRRCNHVVPTVIVGGTVFALDRRTFDLKKALTMREYFGALAKARTTHSQRLESLVPVSQLIVLKNPLPRSLKTLEKRMAGAFRHFRGVEAGVSHTHHDLAILLEAKRLPDEAREQYRKAVEKNPGDSWARSNYAWALLKNEQLKEAEKQYREVLKATPKDRYALLNLSYVLSKKGDYNEAVEFARRFIAIKPERHDRYLRSQNGDINLGAALLGLGETSEAEASFAIARQKARKLGKHALRAVESEIVQWRKSVAEAKAKGQPSA